MSALRLDTGNEYYLKILEITDALLDAGRDRFIVGYTDLHPGGDDLPDSNTTLCLEGTAGAGTTIGSRFEELAELAGPVRHQPRVGVCLDTCHLFAAGYPLVEPAEWDETLNQFDRVVGLELLRILHLNDSVGGLASHRDRHAHIGQGCIGRRGFRNVVADPRLRHLPMLIETPKGGDLAEDITNLRTLRSLARSARR